MKGTVSKYTTAAGKARWRITYDRGSDPVTGKRRQTTKRGFAREKDAHAALRAVLGAVEDGTHVGFDRQTVEMYMRAWLHARKPRDGMSAKGHRGQVGIGTWSSYGDYLDAYVIPRLGQIRLQHLTPGDLNQLYDKLERSGGRNGTGLSAKTVANVHGLLHKALADAVRQGLIARNPADRVDPPRAGKPRTRVWSTEELRAFVDHVRGDRLYPMWLMFVTTGARRGEVAGLCWADLDLDAGRVRISWTLGVVESKPTWKAQPKSEAGERTMALDPATVQALSAWRKEQLEERLAAGSDWQVRATDWRGQSREHLVFTWPDGRMINPERISKWFHQRCQAAGLPKVRLHDVRHSYATAGLANATGWHEVKVISQRLGHASVGITLDTYSHVLPAADERTAHTLARVILGD